MNPAKVDYYQKYPRFRFLSLPVHFQILRPLKGKRSDEVVLNRMAKRYCTFPATKVTYTYNCSEQVFTFEIDQIIPRACWREGLYLIKSIKPSGVDRERYPDCAGSNSLIYWDNRWWWWTEVSDDQNYQPPYPQEKLWAVLSTAKTFDGLLSSKYSRLYNYWTHYHSLKEIERGARLHLRRFRKKIAETKQ